LFIITISLSSIGIYFSVILAKALASDDKKSQFFEIQTTKGLPSLIAIISFGFSLSITASA